MRRMRLARWANIAMMAIEPVELRGRSMPEKRVRIHVVNPNSNHKVTDSIDAAVEPLRFNDGPEIVCSTLAEGPFGIETQADAESVVLPLRRLVEADNASD